MKAVEEDGFFDTRKLSEVAKSFTSAPWHDSSWKGPNCYRCVAAAVSTHQSHHDSAKCPQSSLLLDRACQAAGTPVPAASSEPPLNTGFSEDFSTPTDGWQIYEDPHGDQFYIEESTGACWTQCAPADRSYEQGALNYVHGHHYDESSTTHYLYNPQDREDVYVDYPCLLYTSPSPRD